MKTKKTSSSKTIKQKVIALRKKFEQVQRQAVKIEQAGREIKQQIRDLQAMCKHKHTKNEWVTDVAEMKTRKFCTACGAQC